MDSNKIGFFIGLGGGLTGLFVGLLAAFQSYLPDSFMFFAFGILLLLVCLVLVGTGLFLIFSLPGFLKFVGVFPFFGGLQVWNAIGFVLGNYDTTGFIEKYSFLFEIDILFVMPFVFAIGFIPMVFGMFYLQYVNIFVREKVLKSGFKVDAKIVEFSETSIMINNRRQYKIDVEFTAPKFGKCSHSFITYVSIVDLDKFGIGKTLKIAVSKTNKKYVFIV